MELNFLNEQGKTVDVNEAVFGREYNEALVHQIVVAFQANARLGTRAQLTREAVHHSTKKPWRQKGTGHARQGSIRAPQWTHGGVALGPKPRDYRYALNKKTRRLALKSALTAKVNDNEIMVIDSLKMDEIKTKKFVEIMKNLKIEKKAFFVTGEKEANLIASANNIPGVKTAIVDTINTYDILNHDILVIEKSAVIKLEEVYS